MKTAEFLKRRSGFTLIELLIVVAIIAILAAIAVPNFLEAQTRAKVSRTLADMRTIKTGLESYYVDNNKYPETDLGLAQFALGRRSIFRLTTPVSYLTSIPGSAFKEKYGAGSVADTKIASTINGYLYVRRLLTDTSVDSNYTADRTAYLMLAIAPATLISDASRIRGGQWLMKSVGPDNIDDRDGSDPKNVADGITPQLARIYDPTNGTVSRGDVVTFSDVGGSLK